jgi:hypothetical protein
MSQAAFKPHYEHLKNKWNDQKNTLARQVTEKHKEAFHWLHNTYKHLVVGSLGSLVMLAHPVTTTISAQQAIVPPKKEEPPLKYLDHAMAPVTRLMLDLSFALPETVQPLTEEQEKVIGQTLSRHFAASVSAQLQGHRLNTSYGYIGSEQHLVRYPGDTMATHFSNASDAHKYYRSGMAPGRGAWGYFAPSRAAMTDKDVMREKYYIAVQTFLAPGFTDNIKSHYEFFKYRKMLVVNPENGRAVVADIADAGPSPWTGKQLGGSPEIMSYLERKDGGAKGPVLYFFIDDPDDTIPLGPITPK